MALPPGFSQRPSENWSDLWDDVAEIVDPHVHVAAKIRKNLLAQLPKPGRPKSVLCRQGMGCVPN